ncbi:radical SAM protein [Streptomyces sp.]|uniref:radical SAM protein n=1 Tax=Streptomyces sp. TaxID=1931 RepID=UPI002F4092B9
MELGELLALRPQPGAGLLVCLTRRCPLSCAHCSTDSGPAGGDQPLAEALLRFTATLTPADHPEVMLLTGGEPLLRPGLVVALAALARAAGTRTALLSGMFFAREDGRVPPAVLRAAVAVDHFSASLDIFHERQVPRAAVFAAVRTIRDAGVPISFHLSGTGAADPYLADATAAIRQTFGAGTAVLVNEVRPFGRAASWAAARSAAADEGAGRLAPCAMAAWPVIGFDGTVLACCNQDTVDRRPVPPHLRLGHIAESSWPEVRHRATGSPTLRALRTLGPARLGVPPAQDGRPATYCGTCRAVAEHPAALATAARAGTGLVGEILDREAARAQSREGARGLARRYGCAAYAHLVRPGPGGESSPR